MSAEEKKVPPLRIKNIRSLHTVHISDDDNNDDEEEEENAQSDDQQQQNDNDSSSENEHLVIDEGPPVSEGDDDDDDECLLVEEGANGSVGEDPTLVIDESGAEEDLLRLSRRSSNRHSINSEDNSIVSVETTPVRLSSSNVASGSSRSSRRKSHHVPKMVDDVEFEEATITILPDEVEPAEQEDPRVDVNKNLMSNIAMLKSCINYVLEQQNYKPMAFKFNYESPAMLVEQYNQLKKK